MTMPCGLHNRDRHVCGCWGVELDNHAACHDNGGGGGDRQITMPHRYPPVYLCVAVL